MGCFGVCFTVLWLILFKFARNQVASETRPGCARKKKSLPTAGVRGRLSLGDLAVFCFLYLLIYFLIFILIFMCIFSSSFSQVDSGKRLEDCYMIQEVVFGGFGPWRNTSPSDAYLGRGASRRSLLWLCPYFPRRFAEQTLLASLALFVSKLL